MVSDLRRKGTFAFGTLGLYDQPADVAFNPAIGSGHTNEACYCPLSAEGGATGSPFNPASSNARRTKPLALALLMKLETYASAAG